MSDKKIRESLRTIVKGADRPYSTVGTIQEVNENTCDVKLINSEVVIFDVLINIDNNVSLTEAPVKGSKCIITFLSYNTAYLAKSTMVESYSIVTKDEDGNVIESLKEILVDYATEMYDNLNKMTLKHPQGPTSPNPINDIAFSQSKDDFIERIEKIFNK